MYPTLYTKRQINLEVQEKLLAPIKPKITNKENENLTQKISLSELKIAIFQTENAKSPAIDALPIEFYKSQYEMIKNDLLQLYNSPSIIQAIINLIPKNDKEEHLKNWRPISLLCADYKILTKIISNRLKTTLEHTISKKQICGIHNRSIFSNHFTIPELIAHSTTKKIKAYIVSVDQEKAIDKLS